MIKQPSVSYKLEDTVSELLSARVRHDRIFFIILFLILLSLTPFLAFWGVSAGSGVVIGVLVAPIAALAFVRWPMLGFYLVAASAFIVEQEPLPTHIGTDHLYVFYWPPQLEGFIERPIGVLILLSLLIWILHRFVKHQPLLRGGMLIMPFTLYILCVVGAVVFGLATGGNLKIVMVQLRPFWYTFLSYILAYNFVTRKSHVRNFFWLVIVSAGVKGFQGLYIYLIVYRGRLGGLNLIMSHEESFFFAALLLLLFIFRLYQRDRPQMIACLCVAPAVLISLVENQRRTDYIALLVAMVFAWAIVFRIKPKARRALLIGMIVFSILGTFYILVFSHVSGSLGSPARSIIGVFVPTAGDSRDASSNLYRDYENFDLIYTAKQNPLGLGFGKTFQQPKSLESTYPGIRGDDPYYDSIPHNTIYWVWVDLGPIGFFALWFLFGSIMVRGCFIARQLKDPYLQVIAIYIVCVAVMEVIVAFADYQLFLYRNVITVGLLAGLLAKLPILDGERRETHERESLDGVSAPALSLVGSK